MGVAVEDGARGVLRHIARIGHVERFLPDKAILASDGLDGREPRAVAGGQRGGGLAGGARWRFWTGRSTTATGRKPYSRPGLWTGTDGNRGG
jgi:hypothetical protein